MSILAGLFVTRVLLHVHGVASDDEWFGELLRAAPLDRTDGCLAGRLDHGRRRRVADRRGVRRACCRDRQALASRRVPGVRARRRGRVVSCDDARRPSAAARGSPSRDAARECELLSGHTAAAIAVYCGIALLLTSRIANTGARAAIWTLAVLIPIFVAFSRMYRGMHHPLDVFGGVVIGVAALSALVLVVRRASGRAAR